MTFVLKKQSSWSDKGLSLAIWATLASVFLALAEGIFRGPIAYSHVSAGSIVMFANWCFNFRNISETLISAGVLIFIGGKFLENRTTLTLGFDTLDSSQISMKGPDDNNVVWVGHRYGTRLEAETIAATIESRLKESTAA
jgi:hypothetical protein